MHYIIVAALLGFVALTSACQDDDDDPAPDAAADAAPDAAADAAPDAAPEVGVDPPDDGTSSACVQDALCDPNQLGADQCDQEDGCNWCSCEPDDLDGTFRWACTASICEDDAALEAGVDEPDAGLSSTCVDGEVCDPNQPGADFCDQEDGCNWCSCEPDDLDGGFRWACTASICEDDAGI